MWSPLGTNRKSYMGVQWQNYVWPWVTVKGQIQGRPNFEGLYPVKKPS